MLETRAHNILRFFTRLQLDFFAYKTYRGHKIQFVNSSTTQGCLNKGRAVFYVTCLTIVTTIPLHVVIILHYIAMETKVMHGILLDYESSVIIRGHPFTYRLFKSSQLIYCIRI